MDLASQTRAFVWEEQTGDPTEDGHALAAPEKILFHREQLGYRRSQPVRRPMFGPHIKRIEKCRSSMCPEKRK